MLVKGIIDEDFTQYKKPSMFIAFPKCTFKCCLECGRDICQNSSLVKAEDIEVDYNSLIDRYLNNPITSAIVMGGLEPFDSFNDVKEFINELRWNRNCFDDIVIYTGYNPDEIIDQVAQLVKYSGVIIKFGRFIPDQESKFDEVLGVYLASPNQFAKKI